MESTLVAKPQNSRSRLFAALLSVVLTLSAALLCFSILGGSSSATGKGVDYDLNEDGNPYLNIVLYNVEYGDYMHIAYAVQYSDDFLGEDAELDIANARMLVWNGSQSDYTLANAESAIYMTAPSDITPPESCSNTVVFLSDGIPAKNIADPLYARVYIEAKDGTIYYSNVSKYSVLQYVYDRYAALEASTATDEASLAKEAAQRKLYDSILSYGTAAQIILGYKTDKLADGDYVQIKVTGGVLEDGMPRGLYTLGDSFTLTAKPPVEGYDVLYWTDSQGSVVAESTNTLTVTIDENFRGSESYTAVYDIPTTVTVSGGMGDGSYRNGESYTVTASSTEHFAYWLVNDERMYDGQTSVTATVTTSLGGTVYYEAVYYEPTTVTVSGGEGSGEYYYGESYTVTATVPEGKTFRYWQKDGGATSLEQSFTVTVTSETAEIVVYEAVYYNGVGAHFEDTEIDGAYIRSENAVTTGGYTVYQSSSAPVDETHAIITADPTDPTNKVIKSHKTNTSYGNTVHFKFTESTESGNTWSVLDSYVYIEPTASDTVISQIRLSGDDGHLYQIELRVLDDKICIYDYNVNEGRNFLGAAVSFNEWFHLRVEYTAGNGITLDSDGNVDSNDARAYVYINGECIARSANVWSYNATTGALPKSYNSAAFYTLKAEKVSMYIDDVQCYSTYISAEEEAAKNPAKLFGIPNDQSNFEARYDIATLVIGAEAASALNTMTDTLFGQDVYVWLANLYDSATGAFYYSNSARDNYGYLPDIESTSQAMTILTRLGLTKVTSCSDIFTEGQRAALGSWIQLCQSGRDGYYYHPQWGTDIGDSRKGRDLGNFTTQLNRHALGEELFDGANYRLSGYSSSYSSLAGSTVTQTYAVAQSAMVMSLSSDTESAVSYAVAAISEDTTEEEVKAETSNTHLLSEAALREYLDAKWISLKYNSYSFGNYITSQNAQVKAAGLSYVVIDWFNALQESVQTELENRALDEYYATVYGVDKTALDEATAYRDARADGTVAGMDAADDAITSARDEFRAAVKATAGYTPLTDEQIAKLVKDAGNGLWETTTDGRTISGLLKISGIYNGLQAEFPYVDKAIASALYVLRMDIDEYKETERGITYIYNPPNAIKNLLNNIKSYGSEENSAVRNAAYDTINQKALEIIEKTAEKLAIYKKADGGFGYNDDTGAGTSQGEPAALADAIESDVNGTALALGTRSALISIFSLSDIAILPYHDTAVTVEEGGELLTFTSHRAYFMHLLETAKHDKALKTVGSYDFENVNTLDEVESRYGITTTGDENVSSVATVAKDGNASNKALLFSVENTNDNVGAHVYFSSTATASNVNYYSIEFDMYDNGSSTSGGYEIFVKGDGSDSLKLLCYKNADGIYFRNQYRYDQSGASVTQATTTLTTASGSTKYFSAKSWMHVCVKYYPDATDSAGNAAPYGVLEVTQSGTTYSLTFTETWGAASTRKVFDTFDLFASKLKYGDVYIDNVEVVNYTDGGAGLGYYHFDDITDMDQLPQLQLYGNTVASTASHVAGRVDKYLSLSAAEGGSISAKLAGYKEAGYYNFNEIQLDLRFDEFEAGDYGTIAVGDSDGLTVVTVGYEIIEVDVEGTTYKSVRFFEASSGTTLLAGQYDASLENGNATVNALDYIIDPSDWIRLRFEYHYDMSTPTLYLTARYTDGEGLSDAKAAILEALPIVASDDGSTAVASKMASARITTTAGSISVDNFYVRNVYDER